jgi:ligand-binding sensor domain-containing protein
MNCKRFLLLIFVLIASAAGPAAASICDGRPQGFTRLDDPRLPHRSIFALLQDRDGFLWIGTHDGLARYDGAEMRTFRHDPDDPSSLSSSSIRVLLQDSVGRLWVGTENGLNVLDRSRLKIRRIETPDHSEGRGVWFLCAFEDRDGVLWFGTDHGLFRLGPDEERPVSIPPRSGDRSSFTHAEVVGVQQDASGSIWVATSDLTSWALHRVNADGTIASRDRFDGSPDHLYSLLIDSRGRFWTHPSSPIVLDPDRAIAAGPSVEDQCSDVYSIVERTDGSIWFACNDGLVRIDPTTGQEAGFQIKPSDGTWLENFGRSLLEDRSGILWVGTEGGLYRCDPHVKAFGHLRSKPDDPHTLSADAVSAVAETADGALWVSTYGGGLNRVDPATGRVRRLCADNAAPDRCTSEVIWHLHTGADGTLWVAGSELWSVNPSDETVTRHSPPGAIYEDATYIVEDHRGTLWLGGRGGRLYRFTIASGSFEVIDLNFEHQNAEIDSRIDSMLLEGSRLWLGFGHALGSYDTGCGRLDLAPLVAENGTKVGGLGTWVIHRGGDGTLWLGTSAGLLRRRLDGAFELLTTHEGLPGSTIYSIVEDADGAMWLGTNQGLAHYRPSEAGGGPIRRYLPEDGVGNIEFNRHASCRTSDGALVFGGMDGLTIFDPRTIRDNDFVPPVQITSIEVSNRDGTRSVEPGGLDHLILAPGDSAVRFRFAALNFTSPSLNRYAYRMGGFDVGWTEAGSRRATQYTNLPPGRYRFTVRGSNNDSVWNEEGVTLPVVVQPHLWETWWFRPIVIAMLGCAVWAAYRTRAARRREVERLRMRIAGDLHDDFSSDLSGIAVLADMVRQSGGVDDEGRDDLGQIRDASLRMADGLRDVVWYIDPDHDSLEATVRRMRSVVSTLLRGVSTDFHVEIPERGMPLPVDTRRSLFLIFKEAVHNISRHAGASRVEIEIIVDGSLIRLRVADNGVGFPPAPTEDGHGLRSMRRRADDIGGRLTIESTPGQGTELKLTVEMARSRDGERGAP